MSSSPHVLTTPAYFPTGLERLLFEFDTLMTRGMGRLTCKGLQAALFNLGLKVESPSNMQRLWGALAAGLGLSGQASSLDIMGLANLLNAPAERVARPVPDDTPRQAMYLG